MIPIDELLPADPLHSEVVLHVRRHLRRVLRAGSGTAEDLALLFGLSVDEEQSLDLRAAAASASPLTAAAEVIAKKRGKGTSIVSLGHDEQHVAACHAWLKSRKESEPAFKDIFATDLETLLVLSKAREYATASLPNDSREAIPLVVEGETGTGKELLVRAIHETWARESRRAGKLVAVHVAGLPPDLIVDELFGHAKGAFTGAHAERQGRLEEADGGTLFIDEVGDLPEAAQVLLLRFLQERVLSRPGENTLRPIRVRVIAATWHDLDEDVRKGKFRLDLLHRLRVGVLHLPPLRKRPRVFTEVVPKLLERLGQEAKPSITRSALDALGRHQWPGNLRELDGVLRLALSNAHCQTVRLEDLPPSLQRSYLEQPLYARAPGFLCDQVERQELTKELVSWRADQVTRSMEAMDVQVVVSGASKLHDFLKDIPDNSVEHQATLKDLERSADLARSKARLISMEEQWDKIRAAGLPELVESCVQLQVEALRGRRRAIDGEVADLSTEAAIKNNPWCTVLSELRGLPALADQDPVQVLASVVPLARLLASVSPDMFEKVRLFIIQGRTIERLQVLLKDGVRHVLEEGHAEPDEEETNEGDVTVNYEDLPYARRPSEFWRQVVAEYNSKAEAARLLRVDPKTISKYLQKHVIPEMWGKPLLLGTEAPAPTSGPPAAPAGPPLPVSS